MKNVLALFYCFLVFSGVCAQENKTKASPANRDKISLFSLQDVRLLDSDFKHIMDLILRPSLIRFGNRNGWVAMDLCRGISWAFICLEFL